MMYTCVRRSNLKTILNSTNSCATSQRPNPKATIRIDNMQNQLNDQLNAMTFALLNASLRQSNRQVQTSYAQVAYIRSNLGPQNKIIAYIWFRSYHLASSVSIEV